MRMRRVRLGLPTQLAKRFVALGDRQRVPGLRRRRFPFIQLPLAVVVRHVQPDAAQPFALAHDAQHILERLLIDLAHAQRLRTAIQHLQRFVGLLQAPGLSCTFSSSD